MIPESIAYQFTTEGLVELVEFDLANALDNGIITEQQFDSVTTEQKHDKEFLQKIANKLGENMNTWDSSPFDENERDWLITELANITLEYFGFPTYKNFMEDDNDDE